MKNNFILTTLFAWFAFVALSQNPVRIMAPNYIDKNDVPTQLPLGPGINDYHGQKAECASNAFPDAQGDLKFFIVDDRVFDREGYFIADLSVNASFGSGKGRSEIAIVKDPASCERFYIFTIARDYSQGTSGDQYFAQVLDMSLPSQENNSRLGDLSYTPSFEGPDTKVGNGHWAISKPRNDGSHFVFLSVGSSLRIYKLDQNGFNNTGIYINTGGDDEVSHIRAEMEVYEFPDGNNVKYRVAMPFFKTIVTINDVQDFHAISIMNFDQNGNYLSGNGIGYPIAAASTGEKVPFIKGLEFDPTGQYLFVTHTAVAALGYPTAIDFIDFNVSGTTLVPLNLPGNTDFQNSQIEFMTLNGFSGLYMATENSLGRIIPDANPANIQLQANVFGAGIQSSFMTLDQQPNWSNYVDYKLYLLPDQIDQYDYLSMYFTNNDITCCKTNTSFDKNTFSATTNATWLPGFGSNPLDAVNDGNNVITIRDELRIPKGKVVTIRNMTIRFAPGSKLIIEEGDGVLNGGRLNLDNTKLTVDTRCTNDELWEGVEVWGNATLVQGTPTGNSQQGRLFITGNSVIEHTKKGVVLSAFNNSTGTYITSKGGGVLRATGTTFRNNQRDVVFWNYQSPNGTVNFSYVTNCRFILDDVLKSGVVPINHVELRGVRGVTLRGNDFKHINTEYQQVGSGIFATNSTFTVAAGCTSGTFPCTSYDPNTFENLNMGIQATNSSSILSFNVDRNVFINNNIGIRANATSLASITRNTFKVFETPNYQTGGVYLFKSTKYVVEENNFGIANTTALSGAKAYGLVINNSGPESNLVYRNTFEDLYIGGQSELTNANTQIGNATGLVWKCNTFRDITQHDLTVIKGNIAYNQGYMDPSNAITANQKAANNQFSLQFEDPTIAHDFFLAGAEAINYVYTQGAMTVPDSYTTSFMTIQQSSVNGNPVNFDYVSGCPVRIGKTKIQLNADLVVFQNKLNQNNSILNTGTLATLQSTLNLTNAGNKKNQLLAKSPYLSDEVLIAYMLQSPPNGNLQQVLNANSPLSQAVLDVLISRNLPSGVLNNILSNQTSAPGVRSVLQQDTWYNEANLYRTIDDLLREVILDTDTTRTLDDAVTILTPRQEKVYQEMLVNLKITRNELLDATNLLTTISGYGRTQELNEVQINLKASSDPTCYLTNSLTDQQLLQDIAADTLFCMCSERAKALLCDIIPMDDSYYFLEDENSLAKSSMFTAVTSESSTIDDWQVVLYPNPTTAIITIMNTELSDLNIAVYDVLGSLQATFESIENASTIDLSSFKNGVYLFVIEELSTGKTTTIRVMKK